MPNGESVFGLACFGLGLMCGGLFELMMPRGKGGFWDRTPVGVFVGVPIVAGCLIGSVIWYLAQHLVWV